MLKHAGVRGRSKPVACSFAKSGVCVSHFRIRFRSQRSKWAPSKIRPLARASCMKIEGKRGGVDESKISSADCPPSNVALTFLASGQRGVLVVEACADLQGYGYGGANPRPCSAPADGSVPPGSTALAGARGTAAPSGADCRSRPGERHHLPASAGPPRASRPCRTAQATAPPPAPARSRSSKRHLASTAPMPAQAKAAPPPPPAPVPAQAQAAPPPQPAPAPKPAPAQAAAPGRAGHDADGARHGDHAGDPRIGESGRGGKRRRPSADLTRCAVASTASLRRLSAASWHRRHTQDRATSFRPRGCRYAAIDRGSG